MTQTITVTHRATKDSVTTTVETPYGPPMSKTWKRVSAGHYQLDSDKFWDEEDDLPSEVRDVADESATGLCRALADLED